MNREIRIRVEGEILYDGPPFDRLLIELENPDERRVYLVSVNFPKVSIIKTVEEQREIKICGII